MIYTKPMTDDLLANSGKGRRKTELTTNDNRFIEKEALRISTKGYDVALVKLGKRIYLFRSHDKDDVFKVNTNYGNRDATPEEFLEQFQKGEEQEILKEWKGEKRMEC